jgi:hypothetical protein
MVKLRWKFWNQKPKSEEITLTIVGEEITEIFIDESKFQCKECGTEEITIFNVYPFNTYCTTHIKPYLSDKPGSAIEIINKIAELHPKRKSEVQT